MPCPRPLLPPCRYGAITTTCQQPLIYQPSYVRLYHTQGHRSYIVCVLMSYVRLHSCAFLPALQSVFYLWDVYNDAASIALRQFRKRFMFDEIEAEVNLAFDQFLYLFTDSTYDHIKSAAAAACLPTTFKSQYFQQTSQAHAEEVRSRRPTSKGLGIDPPTASTSPEPKPMDVPSARVEVRHPFINSRICAEGRRGGAGAMKCSPR